MKQDALAAYKCPQCPFQGKSPEGLLAHMALHSNASTLSCTHPTCTYTAKSAHRFAIHAKLHIKKDLGETFTCTQCGVTFEGGPISRGIHMRTAHGVSSKGRHSCSHGVCDYVATTSSNLRKHVTRMHSHAGDSFVCKSCPFTCLLRGDYVKHQLWHNSALPRKAVVLSSTLQRRNRFPAGKKSGGDKGGEESKVDSPTGVLLGEDHSV